MVKKDRDFSVLNLTHVRVSICRLETKGTLEKARKPQMLWCDLLASSSSSEASFVKEFCDIIAL